MNQINCSKGHQNPQGANFCLVCGESLAESQFSSVIAPLNSGTQLRSRYIIQEQLGQGGFGRTYIVKDTGRFEERLLLKEFIPPKNEGYALKKSTELFQREAVALYQLQHQQIPRFYEIFQEESRLFLVEDFIEGKTYEQLLNERLRQGKTGFHEKEMKELLRNLLPVLSYLHKQGIVHRDIAPDNIILNRKTNLPSLIDLGAVKQIALNVTNTPESYTTGATTIGKVGYAPDEQIRLGLVAPYSDLYALGVTVIVLLTGKQPHELLDKYTMEWTWQKYVRVGPQLTQILNRMLEAKPERRFQSADDILYVLNSEVTDKNPQPYYNIPNPTIQYQKKQPQSFVNNSGQGNLFDETVPIPMEIKGWNWGAFLLGFFWSIGNQVWIGLLCFIPYIGWVMTILLGVRGNEWAWKSRRWESIEQFKKTQRAWTVAALTILGAIFGLIFLMVFLVLIFG
jgi:serine/threonine protein kinase